MKKYIMIWANTVSIKYINYHFTHLGEILDYLDGIFPNEVDVLDADAENLDNSHILEQLTKEQYKAIAFYASTENIRETVSLAKMVKSVFPEIKLLAYGPLTLLIPEFFCNKNFDAIYSGGDNELAISNFFKYSNGEMVEKELSGIYLIRDNKLIKTKEGQFIDINDLGFPRVDRLPIDEYNKLNGDKKINLTLSRGCPFSCPHCLVNLSEGNKDRRRNLESLKEYLTTIYSNYTEIKIFSPEFTINKAYVYDFCELVRENFPKLKWDCATRVDTVNDDDLLKVMGESGCTQITLGIETLSEKELASIDKKYDLSKVPEVVEKIKAANIAVKGCIIIGIPGQTKESLKKTLDTLVELGVIVRPMIYTRYQDLKSNMSIDEIENYNRKVFYIIQ